MSPHGEGSSCSRELWFPMPGTGAGWCGADCSPQAEVGRLRTDVTSQWLRPLTFLLLHVSFEGEVFLYNVTPRSFIKNQKSKTQPKPTAFSGGQDRTRGPLPLLVLPAPARQQGHWWPWCQPEP